MANEPRDVPIGYTTTYTESVLRGGSVMRYMVEPALQNTPEGRTFFEPKNAEQARIPLGLLSGEYTREEIDNARKSGGISLEFIGRMLSPQEEIGISFAPLDEKGVYMDLTNSCIFPERVQLF